MEARAANFSALPEDCIAQILSWTSPDDVCNLSLVSHSFKSAAYSDAVWEKFVPLDYQNILSQSSSSSSLHFSSKKDLFFYLCDHPVLIDEGKKSFSLDKRSGKKCYMLAPRDMSIVGVDMPPYWEWISIPDSRFPEIPELRVVCWLEMRGKISTAMLSSDTNYAAYLVFNIRKDAYYGLAVCASEVALRRTGENKQIQNVCLDPFLVEKGIVPQNGDKDVIFDIEYTKTLPRPKKRKDGWFEVKLGEFFNEKGNYSELEMSLMEVKSSCGKRGLIVQGIEIRPKEDK